MTQTKITQSLKLLINVAMKRIATLHEHSKCYTTSPPLNIAKHLTNHCYSTTVPVTNILTYRLGSFENIVIDFLNGPFR